MEQVDASRDFLAHPVRISPLLAHGSAARLNRCPSLTKPGAWSCRLAECLLLLLVALLQPIVTAAAAAPTDDPSRRVDIEFFTRARCPHCDDATRFLGGLAKERPELRIVISDVEKESGARERLNDFSSKLAVGAPGVPAFYVRGELIVGFAGPATTGARIKALLDQAAHLPPGQPPSAAGLCALDDNLTCVPGAELSPTSEALEIPFVGMRLTVEDLGLPLSAVVIGILDGLNPCSMWVLVLMISMLATLKDRKRMLLVAGTFVAVEGLAYFAFMAAWLNLFLFIGISRISEIILGAIAGVAGIVNIKDYWAYGCGVSLSIPSAAKPGLYARMRRILQAEDALGAVLGAVVLAVLVQLVELLCTSGFPALYTRILTLQRLDPASYYGYLLLYNLFYMLDDVIVLGVGVITLSQRRLQEREGKWLKLLSGLVMLGLGAYLIAAPR
jgi:glutaredoxin